MKKFSSLIIICVLLLIFVGCESETTNKATGPSAYTPNYYDAESFEHDLNAGIKVNGKIVQFYVNDYKPDSILGINCWAGEHLNFISEEELDVEKGDFIIGRITAEPSKTLIGGSWKIPYEVLEIRADAVKYVPGAESENNAETTSSAQETEIATLETTSPQITIPETTTPATTSPKNISIIMTADATSYIGKTVQEVEEDFGNLGFENIKLVETVTTDSNKATDTVASVTAAANTFSKGQSFETNTEITISYWKVEKPASEYEKAFVRVLNGYSLYYMFDIDKKSVVFFGTHDTYVDMGTYTGDFSSGVTINWSHGEWTEKFINKDGSSYATSIDGNGFNWEYKACNVADAQKILDSLK